MQSGFANWVIAIYVHMDVNNPWTEDTFNELNTLVYVTGFAKTNQIVTNTEIKIKS